MRKWLIGWLVDWLIDALWSLSAIQIHISTYQLFFVSIRFTNSTKISTSPTIMSMHGCKYESQLMEIVPTLKAVHFCLFLFDDGIVTVKLWIRSSLLMRSKLTSLQLQTDDIISISLVTEAGMTTPAYLQIKRTIFCGSTFRREGFFCACVFVFHFCSAVADGDWPKIPASHKNTLVKNGVRHIIWRSEWVYT